MTGTNHLALHFETPSSVGDKIGNFYQAWFEPPKTGKYRFYMACDTKCRLNFGETAKDSSSATKLLDVTQYTSYRDYWVEDGITRVSKWLNLVKGEKYYIEGRHSEGTHTDHMVVGVEIEDNLPNHHHAMKEVQEVSVHTT